MINAGNRIFTNVKDYVSTKHEKVNYQNVALFVPDKFPALSVRVIDNSEVAIDLDKGNFNDEVPVDVSVEIQAYSNKSETEAMNIMTSACEAMRGMTFRRDYGPMELKDRTDMTLYRVVARFSRIVCSLDDIPRFELVTD